MRPEPALPPATQPAADRRERFARAYVRDLNATKAYLAAIGGSPANAQERGSEMLAEPWVRARIEELLKERYAEIDLKTEQVIRQLVNIAFFDTKDLFAEDGSLLPVNEMPEYARRCIDSIEVDEVVKLERTHEIDNDTGEVKERVQPVRVITRKVKLSPRQGALQMLAKHQGLLDDRVKLTLEDGVTDAMDEAALAARVAGILEAARVRREAARQVEDLL